MKKLPILILFSAILLGPVLPVAADPPRKQTIGRYSSLWSKSPFTVPPVIEEAEEGPGALDDYVLTGVSKLPEGYFVSLMNKKDRDDRITIIPGQPNARGYQVLSVIQDPYDYKETKVRIKIRGEETSTVGYDEKYLTLKKAAVAAQKPNPAQAQGRPGTPTPRPPVPTARPTTTNRPSTPTRTSSSSTGRPPRVRRLPTPNR